MPRDIIHLKIAWHYLVLNSNFSMTFFFCFVNKRAIYPLGIISLTHVLVQVTDFPVVNVHVDELSSARIRQHKLCATLSAKININYRLPIKVYYCICTLRHIRIIINHGSQNVLWVLTWVGRWRIQFRVQIRYIDWKTGIYIYACGICCTQFMLPNLSIR